MVADVPGRKALNEGRNSIHMIDYDKPTDKLLSDDNNPKHPTAYEGNR